MKRKSIYFQHLAIAADDYESSLGTESIIGQDLSFRPVNFLSSLCRGSRKFFRVSKNNTATSFQEAPCRISKIGMESRS